MRVNINFGLPWLSIDQFSLMLLVVGDIFVFV